MDESPKAPPSQRWPTRLRYDATSRGRSSTRISRARRRPVRRPGASRAWLATAASALMERIAVARSPAAAAEVEDTPCLWNLYSPHYYAGRLEEAKRRTRSGWRPTRPTSRPMPPSPPSPLGSGDSTTLEAQRRWLSAHDEALAYLGLARIAVVQGRSRPSGVPPAPGARLRPGTAFSPSGSRSRAAAGLPSVPRADAIPGMSLGAAWPRAGAGRSASPIWPGPFSCFGDPDPRRPRAGRDHRRDRRRRHLRRLRARVGGSAGHQPRNRRALALGDLARRSLRVRAPVTRRAVPSRGAGDRLRTRDQDGRVTGPQHAHPGGRRPRRRRFRSWSQSR